MCATRILLTRPSQQIKNQRAKLCLTGNVYCSFVIILKLLRIFLVRFACVTNVLWILVLKMRRTKGLIGDRGGINNILKIEFVV